MDFKVSVISVVGDKPRSAKDSTEELGLETLEAIDVGLLSSYILTLE